MLGLLAMLNQQIGKLDAAVTSPLQRWQRRFYDFVVFTESKRIEKLRYMHRNPVKRGLVPDPDQWAWSNFRYYAYGERGKVLIDERKTASMKLRNVPAKLAG